MKDCMPNKSRSLDNLRVHILIDFWKVKNQNVSLKKGLSIGAIF